MTNGEIKNVELLTEVRRLLRLKTQHKRNLIEEILQLQR